MSRFVRVDLWVRIVFVFLLLIYIWFLLDFVCNIKKKKAPFLPSTDKDLDFIINSGILDSYTAVTDLGCGHGWVLRYLLTQWVINEARWYDRNLLLILRWKLCNLSLPKPHPKLIQWDFTKVPIHTECIYIYLVPSQLQILENRFRTTLHPSWIIISNSFQFPNWKPSQTLTNTETWTTFYIYSHS